MSPKEKDGEIPTGSCPSGLKVEKDLIELKRKTANLYIMLISNNSLRLTPSEHHQLKSLTGSDTSRITTTIKLKNFVAAHLVNFPGRSSEERLLRKMLESFLPG